MVLASSQGTKLRVFKEKKMTIQKRNFTQWMMPAALLVLSGCDADDEDRSTGSEADEVVEGDGQIDTDAEESGGSDGDSPVTFSATAAEEEGYWYSRYNLGSLVTLLTTMLSSLMVSKRSFLLQMLIRLSKWRRSF